MLNGNNYLTLAIRKDRKCPVTEMKFSLNEKFLAVGGVDGVIIIYRADLKFKPYYHLKGHTGAIKFFDFSVDSRVIKSVCEVGDFFYNLYTICINLER